MKRKRDRNDKSLQQKSYCGAQYFREARVGNRERVHEVKFVTRVLYAREVEREVHCKKMEKQKKVIRTTMQDTRVKIPQHRRAASKIIPTKVHPLCFNGHCHII